MQGSSNRLHTTRSAELSHESPALFERAVDPGKDRVLSLTQNDLLAIRSSGAYAFGMASNYNSRTRAAEVMIDGDRHYCVRERESFADLVRGESLLP